MSEKQPQAGDWWQKDDTRVCIVGTKKNGVTTVGEMQSGTLIPFLPVHGWQHLPDCDSFDWQPAADLPPMKSPDEYRILREDEKTVATDERMYPDGYRTWTAITAMDGWESGMTMKELRAKFVSWNNVVVRRKVVTPQPTSKRVPVRLYWYDGNIVGRYDHSQPTDPSFWEIKHDGYKFYVEVQQ